MSDVTDTGRILSFSEAEMAEWKALFAFWEEHPTPESLPASPHTIRMEDGRSYTMCGPPSWEELWRVLRRFPRSHRETQRPPPPPLQNMAGGGTLLVAPPPAAAGGGTQLAAGDDGEMPPPPQVSAADRLALMNPVGGMNAPPALRKAAHVRKNAQERMIAKGKHVRSVTLGQPYFVEINHCEGEIMVGVAVPRCRKGDDGDVRYHVEWFSRKPCALLTQTHELTHSECSEYAPHSSFALAQHDEPMMTTQYTTRLPMGRPSRTRE